LVETPGAVLIADYKTNRPAPRRLDDVPRDYVRQLALYRHVLARLYPDRTIRAALIWTDTSELMEIPSAVLDQALAHVTSARGALTLRGRIHTFRTLLGPSAPARFV